VDVYWSTDLVNWNTEAAYFPGKMLPNIDVTAVSGRDDMTFLMIDEDGGLIATNATRPISGWRKIAQHVPHFGTDFGCPSINVVDEYFLVLQGGAGVYASRSRDLLTWEVAKNPVMVCGGGREAQDWRTAKYPGICEWVPPPFPVGHAENITQMIWLDRATIRFRVLRPNSGYTGSFCVFGSVLSSPAHGAPYLAMSLL
jgi:hypothetical protein